jgi:hypothetical protein
METRFCHVILAVFPPGMLRGRLIFSSIVPRISVIGLEVGWFTSAVIIRNLCSMCNRESDESDWPLWPGINKCQALLLVGSLWDGKALARTAVGFLLGHVEPFKGFHATVV